MLMMRCFVFVLFCSRKESYANADMRKVDGLSDLNYTLISLLHEDLFTKVRVEFSGPRDKSQSLGYFHEKVKMYKKKMQVDQ